MPHDLPPWPTVYATDVGVLQVYGNRDEPSLARKGAPPQDGVNSSAAIIDSQSVKTTEVAQAVGYDVPN